MPLQIRVALPAAHCASCGHAEDRTHKIPVQGQFGVLAQSGDPVLLLGFNEALMLYAALGEVVDPVQPKKGGII